MSWIPAAILESLGVERRKHWRFRQADGSIGELRDMALVSAVS